MEKLTQKQLLSKCHRKKSHKNIDEANLAGLKQMKIFDSAPLYYYLCSNCNRWHLTHHRTKYRVV